MVTCLYYMGSLREDCASHLETNLMLPKNVNTKLHTSRDVSITQMPETPDERPALPST